MLNGIKVVKLLLLLLLKLAAVQLSLTLDLFATYSEA